ncbi:DUF2889 domain-containing protein [Variovorax sp. KK3]|uniref:DUF2889 domain-containing protein n=1 Tax=Variovorax sp. KK3 TaxID=1855728 RepID=UPI00097CA168|nr:DUF2889 domain-containing protein [Variovorax sp. KK3]
MKELSPAAPRALLHTRRVECTGWEREDGLFDVEGRMSDVRTRDQDGTRGNVPRLAGEPVHLMSLRLTLDEHFTIVAAEACTHQAPFADCGDVNDLYGRLVGLQIKGGLVKAVKERFSGHLGCTHLTELLGPMATTAFQAIGPAMELRRAQRGEPMDDPKSAERLLDSCHGLRRGGHAAVVRWGARGA